MKLVVPAQSVLFQLKELLEQLSTEQYCNSLEVFSGASFGQHTRHILEFYQCLLENIEEGCINYDSRKRQNQLETDTNVAIRYVNDLIQELNKLKEDKQLILKGELAGEAHQVQSSISRELLYTIEHAVHHMAIIKMGILVSGYSITVSRDFGVADSTVKYRADQCAQ